MCPILNRNLVAMTERDNKRLQIITLMKHGHLSMREIARRLDCDHRSVSRTWERYQSSGDYRTQYSHHTRPPTFDERLSTNPTPLCHKSSACELLNEFGASGDYSVRTMQRTMNNIGCKAIIQSGRRPYLNND